MNSRVKKITCLILTVIFVIGTSIPAFAAEGNNIVTLNASDYDKPDKLENDVYKYLSDTDIDSVIVLTEECSEDIYTSLNRGTIPDSSPLTTSPVYYPVKNVVNKGNVTGTSDLAMAIGEPGITVSIEKTKSVSTTLSATFGATYGAISAAVGWDVTGSESISIKGSAKVPSKHNNKKVKTMTLHAKPIYNVKEFDVYRYVPGYVNDKLGTGKTQKAVQAVSFTKTYVYK